MSKKFYVGIDNIAKTAKKIYIGVDGIARKVKKAYIGVDGIARLCYITEYPCPSCSDGMGYVYGEGYCPQCDKDTEWAECSSCGISFCTVCNYYEEQPEEEKCPNCGKIGTLVTILCPNCGEDTDSKIEHCESCGYESSCGNCGYPDVECDHANHWYDVCPDCGEETMFTCDDCGESYCENPDCPSNGGDPDDQDPDKCDCGNSFTTDTLVCNHCGEETIVTYCSDCDPFHLEENTYYCSCGEKLN